jgi:ribonuclease P protein component
MIFSRRGSVKKNAFPKRLRLLGNDEFRAVIAKRYRCGNDLMAMYASPNGLGDCRLGVSAGKAVGNAVVRNRFKRLVREVFRMHRQEITAGVDYVVIAGKAAKELAFNDVEESFLKLASKISNLKFGT